MNELDVFLSVVSDIYVRERDFAPPPDIVANIVESLG